MLKLSSLKTQDTTGTYDWTVGRGMPCIERFRVTRSLSLLGPVAQGDEVARVLKSLRLLVRLCLQSRKSVFFWPEAMRTGCLVPIASTAYKDRTMRIYVLCF